MHYPAGCPPPKGTCTPRTRPWETVSPFVIFPSHFSDWIRYLWAVIYCISELILCSAIVKHSCGPAPQGDIYFFLSRLSDLTCFSLSFSLFASCFPFPSIVNWQVQHSSSQNKTIIENKKSNAPILMRQLY